MYFHEETEITLPNKLTACAGLYVFTRAGKHLHRSDNGERQPEKAGAGKHVYVHVWLKDDPLPSNSTRSTLLQPGVALMCPNAHQHVGAPHVLASVRIVTMYASSWRESPSYRPLPASASPDRPAPHLLAPLFPVFQCSKFQCTAPHLPSPLVSICSKVRHPVSLVSNVSRNPRICCSKGERQHRKIASIYFNIQKTQIYYSVFMY